MSARSYGVHRGRFVSNTTISMPRGTSWSIGRPALRAATGNVGLVSRWNVSTKSGDTGQAATMQSVKMPRLTNRMRRLARAHPEAVAAVSPAAVEESRARYGAADLPHGEVSKKLLCTSSVLSLAPSKSYYCFAAGLYGTCGASAVYVPLL